MLNKKYEFYSRMLYNKTTSDVAIKTLRKLNCNITCFNVYGFNSSRFDSNLFKSLFNYEFSNMHWTVESPIGIGSSLKQFILTANSTDSKLIFVNAQAYIGGSTLKAFAKECSGIDNGDKGVFQCETIATVNYDEALSMIESFISLLHQFNLLTDEQYEQYVIDACD